jgi:hypothetical protein
MALAAQRRSDEDRSTHQYVIVIMRYLRMLEHDHVKPHSSFHERWHKECI